MTPAILLRLSRMTMMSALLAVWEPMAAGSAPAPELGRVDDARMRVAGSEPENWMINGGTLYGERYSLLNQINTTNVAQLKPAWSFAYDTTRGQEAEPLVVDGVMYVTTAWSKVYALDAVTGRQLWFFDPKVPGEQGAKACCDVVNRGAAVYRGKVYVATIDGRLIALHAGTGQEMWSAQTTDPRGHHTITGAPRVYRNKVIIGNGGADLGARGYVTAYDTETGKLLWRFYLVPGDPGKPDNAASDSIMEKLVRPTWSGNYARSENGGTAWNAIAYDPDFDRVYIGTGNGSPWNPTFRTARKGDNLFLCSVVALDLDTGRYVWHYQQNPQEAWDYNSAMPMILTHLTIDGRSRKVLLHAPKNGLFYVIDRATGKVISAKPYVPVTWTTGLDARGRPIEVAGARYEKEPFMVRPSASGAHNWHGMAFSAQTGLVYLSAAENGMRYGGSPAFNPQPYLMNTGVDISGFLPNSYFLLAWDPVMQREAWRVPLKGGGVLATAGGLVFQGRGNGSGELAAMRATDGKQLWSYPTPNGIEANPISYAVNGVQYIAVSAGIRAGGIMDTSRPLQQQPGRMIVFRLGGTAKLPEPPPPARGPTRVTEEFAAADVAHGAQLYRASCGRCHGSNAASNNIITDLRRSAVLANEAAWAAIVHDGILRPRGMIGWSNWMSRKDVEDIRAYVASRAIALEQELAAGGTSATGN